MTPRDTLHMLIIRRSMLLAEQQLLLRTAHNPTGAKRVRSVEEDLEDLANTIHTRWVAALCGDCKRRVLEIEDPVDVVLCPSCERTVGVWGEWR